MPTELQEPGDPWQLEEKGVPWLSVIAEALMLGMLMEQGLAALRHLPATAHLKRYGVLFSLVAPCLVVLVLQYRSWWGGAKQQPGARGIASICFFLFISFGLSASLLFQIIGQLALAR